MCQAQNACMIVWLSIFREIRWMVVYRSGQMEDRFLKDLLPQKRHIGGMRIQLST